MPCLCPAPTPELRWLAGSSHTPRARARLLWPQLAAAQAGGAPGALAGHTQDSCESNATRGGTKWAPPCPCALRWCLLPSVLCSVPAGCFCFAVAFLPFHHPRPRLRFRFCFPAPSSSPGDGHGNGNHHMIRAPASRRVRVLLCFGPLGSCSGDFCSCEVKAPGRHCEVSAAPFRSLPCHWAWVKVVAKHIEARGELLLGVMSSALAFPSGKCSDSANGRYN